MAFGKLSALLLLTLLTIFTVKVSGSCLEYGHSCWGAHGKRSDPNKIAYSAAAVQPNAAIRNDVFSVKSSSEHDDFPSAPSPLRDGRHGARSGGEERRSALRNLLRKRLISDTGFDNFDVSATERRGHRVPSAGDSAAQAAQAAQAAWRRLPLLTLRNNNNRHNDDSNHDDDNDNDDDGWLQALDMQTGPRVPESDVAAVRAAYYDF